MGKSIESGKVNKSGKGDVVKGKAAKAVLICPNDATGKSSTSKSKDGKGSNDNCVKGLIGAEWSFTAFSIKLAEMPTGERPIRTALRLLAYNGVSTNSTA